MSKQTKQSPKVDPAAVKAAQAVQATIAARLAALRQPRAA